ncbi:hypothetical protein [Dokdonella fugitiva]|jgi:subtilisin-like proprotein convertase family protein|uniref:P/Homo B domain-containing protein n=1 Tax=Dokdonella fugitiva TaxID=328517 RepID=A0A4R2IEM1_9GAMM|nr:hypothetical protein [Dokdonella fugitiva]MBA8884969.1 subtilisin-like proprotein convertase family protein [Dokdonella fugitiva]TCO42068.1 hypothetical protein EV148_102427 [Dokdonella fugitiva]
MGYRTIGSFLLATLAFAAPDASAQASLSSMCAALSNSALREPDWYAQACRPSLHANPLPTAPVGLGNLAYQFNMRAGDGPTFDSLQSFILPDAATATVIGPQTGNIYGLEYDDATATLWGVDDLLQLGTLDTTTGAFTPSVTITGTGTGENPTGITFVDPASAFYLSTADGTDSFLYTLDTNTGAATLVGPMGVALMIDIAINAQGEMYGHDIDTDSIYSIDTSTGAATLIGPTGFAANFAQGMEFDKTTGVLYAWLYQGGGVNTFATIDLATGAATSVATPLAGEYEGAITGSPPVIDLIFENGFDGAPPEPSSVQATGTGTGSIPDGVTCGTPGELLTVSFDVSGVTSDVSGVRVNVTGTHTWVGDVALTLAAPGGSPSMLLFAKTGSTTPAGVGDSSDFAGPYDFADDATGDWWAQASATGATAPIPAGAYRTSQTGGTATGGGTPTSLAATFGALPAAAANGTWTLTATDQCPADTGSIDAATLTVEFFEP